MVRPGSTAPAPPSTRPRSRWAGSVTGEHGIGVAKRDWLVRTRGEGAVRAMRAVKAALDPLGILNPGKVLPDGE